MCFLCVCGEEVLITQESIKGEKEEMERMKWEREKEAKGGVRRTGKI